MTAQQASCSRRQQEEAAAGGSGALCPKACIHPGVGRTCGPYIHNGGQDLWPSVIWTLLGSQLSPRCTLGVPVDQLISCGVSYTST
mmetsp:Transcript_34531/g.76742  ORF Transcript_34531/g.76742 Transcript_34531/m.76742 type:complete len:86 (+) Transcript_34531:654-911(+)